MFTKISHSLWQFSISSEVYECFKEAGIVISAHVHAIGQLAEYAPSFKVLNLRAGSYAALPLRSALSPTCELSFCAARARSRDIAAMA
ncbi:MAG: hypothetical protein R8G34_01000 [Paracoccaceae bacterium]|nr:hypothetical protein [Paracoccaceae bacterium]